MIDKQIIANLRLLHGSYNMLVFLLFLYQARLGLKIRQHRKNNAQSFEIIKRHRKLGPIFAAMGIAGFFAGAALIYLDHGKLLKYPVHFITGVAIVFSIISAFLISKKIKGPDSKERNAHLRRGILILALYSLQIFWGIGILF